MVFFSVWNHSVREQMDNFSFFCKNEFFSFLAPPSMRARFLTKSLV